MLNDVSIVQFLDLLKWINEMKEDIQQHRHDHLVQRDIDLFDHLNLVLKEED